MRPGGHENYFIPSCHFTYNQGDQIGRIFAYWAIVYFGQFYENYKRIPNFLGNFFPPQKLCINFDKKVLGHSLGDSFKNSSGHPAYIQIHSIQGI
jgi:hypothetical protein